MPRFFFLLFMSFWIIAVPAHADATLNTDDEARVRQLVRETLLENPEILMEAMQILQARQQELQAQQQLSALESLRNELIRSPLTPVGGNPDGDVVLIEFFDYQCGFCKRTFPSVKEALAKDGKVKMIYKEFAILGPESVIAARAALAAHKQNRYEDLHDSLMEARGRLSEQKILRIAADMGLDMDQLKADMQGDDITAELNRTRELAQQLNITGTPGFIIGDQVIPGALPADALIEAIQDARAQQG